MLIKEKKIDIEELKKAIQLILKAFNEQKVQYVKIINSLEEKISLLKKENKKLKEENNLYKKKLYTLQKNIKYVSKRIYQLRDDEESFEEKHMSDNNKNNKNNSIEQNQNLKIKLTKDNDNKFFKKIKSNKFGLNKFNTYNQKSKELNNYINKNKNFYSRDDDIQIKKKDYSYMCSIYKILNDKKIKNKEDSKTKISHSLNDDNK